VLRGKNRRRRCGRAKHIEWHDNIDEVPEGPAVILANEYFDVRRSTSGEARTGWPSAPSRSTATANWDSFRRRADAAI